MKSRLDEHTTTAIKMLLDAFLSTWNHKDLAGFIANFHDDAEFTDVVNQTAIGKQAIMKQHEFAFNVVMKHATFEMSNLLLREIISDVIIVSAHWLNKNSQTPDGRPLPDRTGAIQFVITKDPHGNWKFKLVHNVDFALPYQSRDQFLQ